MITVITIIIMIIMITIIIMIIMNIVFLCLRYRQPLLCLTTMAMVESPLMNSATSILPLVKLFQR